MINLKMEVFKSGIPLPYDVALSLAAQEKGLTPFGKFARYLFIAAIQLYALKKHNDAGAKVAKTYAETAFGVCEKQLLIKKGAPKEVLSNRMMDPHSVFLVYGGDIRTYFRNRVKEDPSVPTLEKDLFKRAMVFMSTNIETTDSALAANERIAWQISDHLGSLYNDIVRLNDGANDVADKKGDIATMCSEAQAIAKKLTGSTKLYPSLTLSEKAKTDKNMATLYEQYRSLIKELKKSFDVQLRKLTGTNTIENDKLEKQLAAKGFEIFFFPTVDTGFKGRVGLVAGKMRLYTSNGQLLKTNIAPSAKVKMNPKYKPDSDDTFYCSYTIPNAVSMMRMYTENYEQTSREENFSKVENIAPAVDKWVAKWRTDLKSKDPYIYAPATVAYLLYMTGARVGSSKESRSLKGAANTYGISTLRYEHMKVTGTSIIMDYNGKKGMHQRHVLKIASDPAFKLCARNIENLMKGKRKGDLVFSFTRPNSRTGTVQEVNYSYFTKYMKATGVTVKIHALRHFRGTKLAKELLNTVKFVSPRNASLTKQQKAAEDYIKTKILTQVGALLGHAKSDKTGKQVTVWQTAIKSYVNPNVIRKWFVDNQFEVPKWVPTKLDMD